MNYYEELGIRPDADEEEIRKAHRRLVKLMHPDQHRDQGLKQLAETQMRRLNSIVATLLDPEERAEYDDELRGVDIPGPAGQQSTWRSVPWWIASTLGAIILTVAAVWFWADRIGSSFATHTPTVVENPDTSVPEKQQIPPVAVSPAPAPAGDAQTQPNTTVASVAVPGKKAETPSAPFPPPPTVTPSVPDSAKGHAAPVPPPPHPKEPPPVVKSPDLTAKNPPPSQHPVAKPIEPPKVSKVDPARNVPPVVQKAVAPAVPPKIDGNKKLGDLPLVSKVEPPKQNWDNKLQAPGPSVSDPVNRDNVGLVAMNGSPSIPRPPDITTRPPLNGNHDPLEGEWVYAPTEPEKRKSGLYPPEFINLKLMKEQDGMHGQYSARYSVADSKPVSPDVNFVLKSVDKTSRKYVWTAADGSHGTFVIRSLETDTMRLEWRTTSLRGGPALTSGMATLVRRIN